MLGCSQTNARDGIDAAVDTREVPRDGAMEVTRESLCVGLDPASAECAREVLARIARHECEDVRACHPGLFEPRHCDVYAGDYEPWLRRNQMVRVRLGKLRVDLDAAVCTLRESFCDPAVRAPCEPLFVPTSPTSQCMVQEECGRDAYCVGASSTSACELRNCAPRLLPGAACVGGPTDVPCAWGERCIEDQCRRPGEIRVARAGESCRESARGETFNRWLCEEGTRCVVTSSRPMFEQTCVRVPALGEPCTAYCELGLTCRDFVCTRTPLPNAGDACSPEDFGGFCADAAWGMPCVDGRCVLSTASLGQACHQSFRPCTEGYCGYSDEPTPTPICIAERLAIGDFCVDLEQCENGLCCGGVCVPLAE